METTGETRPRGNTTALVIVAAVVTVIAFFLKPVIFPSIIPQVAQALQLPTPPNYFVPSVIFLGFWDSLGLGVGIALLIWGATSYSRWPENIRKPLLLVLLGALQLTLPNWFHIGLHESVGFNYVGLLAIDFVFHVPWLIFAAILFVAIRQMTRA